MKIIGHKKNIQLLEQILENQKIPHAFLFYGPDEVGKRTVAIEFSKGILCQNHKFGGCNSCNSCNEWHQIGQARDFFLVIPDENGIIPISIARNIITFLLQTPGIAKNKVVVIDQADRLTEEAKNSLLKTLEEPPLNSVIILISSKPGKLPETIRSRVLPLRFSLVSEEEMAEIPSQIRQFAFGKPGRALKLMQDQEFRKKMEIILSKAQRAISGNDAEKIFFAQKISQEPELLDFCIFYWLDLFHQMLRKEKNKAKLYQIGQNARLILTTSFLLEDTKVQPRLLLENMFLSLK